MRVLVLSDVHSNLAALNAVLADAAKFDLIWSLGDIVGYGPQPNECITRLGEFKHIAIGGNHDWGVLGRIDLAEFNAQARHACLWTREQLSPLSLSYLQALPEMLVEEDYTLAHGSPRHPIWEYLLDINTAKSSFSFYDTAICMVGHTHIPAIYSARVPDGHYEEIVPEEGSPRQLSPDRYIVNPGGVGQPRDGDPRAAYLLLDSATRTIEHRRVSYDVRDTQQRMRSAGLPQWLIARLEIGW